jgi:hypothetical protein
MALMALNSRGGKRNYVLEFELAPVAYPLGLCPCGQRLRGRFLIPSLVSLPAGSLPLSARNWRARLQRCSKPVGFGRRDSLPTREPEKNDVFRETRQERGLLHQLFQRSEIAFINRSRFSARHVTGDVAWHR